MNPTSIVFESRRLTLCFDSMADAAQFIESQSENRDWRALWTLTYTDFGASVTTTERVVLHLGKTPTPVAEQIRTCV